MGVNHAAENNSTILVACSGGVDSMTLLQRVYQISAGSVPLKALHVNYGLREEESDGDQKLVESFCSKSKIELAILDLRHEAKPQGGIQAWAREKRYKWMLSEARNQNDLIALAHHQNDIAENIIFRLTRGFTSKLSGMEMFAGQLWRPFLEITRKEILEEASRQNIPYREDSSNAKMTYTRNHIRHRIIKEIDRVSEGAARRLCQAARDIDDIVEYVEKLGEDLVSGEYLNWSDIKHLPHAVGKLYIQKYLSQKTQQAPVGKEVLDQVWSNLSSGLETRIDLNGEYSVIFVSGRVQAVLKSAARTRFDQYKKGMQVLNTEIIPTGATVEKEAKEPQKG